MKAQVWEFIYEKLKAGKPVALLVVLQSKGSSPGRKGFKMALDEGGFMAGSIGGGMMEHKLVEVAKILLKSGSIIPILKHQIHSKSASQNQSGMICSGEQTVALYVLQSQDLPVVSKIISAYKKKQPIILICDQDGIDLDEAEIFSEQYRFSQKSETEWYFQEKIAEREIVYLIGGGHVSLALSRVLDFLNFEIHLFEDRPELNTFLENDFAYKKQVVSYTEIGSYIPENDHHFIVIMTFGYRTDGIVLRQLLGKKMKYIGLLGSQAKIAQMFSELRAEGNQQEDINAIHAPVGLPIKSQTPEEISISIAAQIIQIKNR